MRELTLRAVVVGALIGAVLAVGNVYMGLKSGWGDQGNITAALLSFCLFAVLPTRERYTSLENNITQTVACSAGLMSFTTGVVTAMPALSLMGVERPAWAVMAWGAALSVVGVLIAYVLRDRMLVEQGLPFPSGIATARLIETMHRTADGARRSAKWMISATVVAMATVWFRDGRPKWISRNTQLPLKIRGLSISDYTWELDWSPLLFGIGLLVGPRVGLSLLAGAVLSWGVLAPWLHERSLLVAGSGFSAMNSWLLWPGVMVMAGAALTQLLLQWRTFARAFSDLGQLRPGSILPQRTLLLLPLVSAVAILLLGWQLFDMHPLLTLAALLLSGVFAVVCARATGEMDIAPVTQMGQLTQLAAGPATVANPAANLMTGSVVAGVSAQTSLTLWALKTGHLLKARPSAQVIAQLLGAVVGAVVVVPAYQLISRSYGLGTGEMPAPAAMAWRALATLVSNGAPALPPGASVAAVVGLLLGVVLACLERTKAGRFLPSPVALGMGFLQPASFALMIGFGGVVIGLVRRRDPKWAESGGAAVAAGAIAGEALMGVVIAFLLGVGWLSVRRGL